MRNLRTHYGKELGKVKASISSGAGAADVYIPNWRCYEQLHFLRDSITPVKTRPTPGIPGGSTLIDLDLTYPEFLNDDEENAGFATLTPKAVKSAAKNKKKMEDAVLEKSLEVLEDVSNKRKMKPEEDGDTIFGKHVCQSLKDIKDKRSKELVKLKIQQLLFEAQFGNNNSQQATPATWDNNQLPTYQRLY